MAGRLAGSRPDRCPSVCLPEGQRGPIWSRSRSFPSPPLVPYTTTSLGSIPVVRLYVRWSYPSRQPGGFIILSNCYFLPSFHTVKVCFGAGSPNRTGTLRTLWPFGQSEAGDSPRRRPAAFCSPARPPARSGDGIIAAEWVEGGGGLGRTVEDDGSSDRRRRKEIFHESTGRPREAKAPEQHLQNAGSSRSTGTFPPEFRFSIWGIIDRKARSRTTRPCAQWKRNYRRWAN